MFTCPLIFFYSLFKIFLGVDGSFFFWVGESIIIISFFMWFSHLCLLFEQAVLVNPMGCFVILDEAS